MEISNQSENDKSQEIKNYNITNEEYKILFEKNKKLLLKINRFKNNNLLNYNNLNNNELEDIIQKYNINQKIIQDYNSSLKELEKEIDELKNKGELIENNIINLINKDFTKDQIKEYIEENDKLNNIHRKINKIKNPNNQNTDLSSVTNYNSITVLQERIDISKYKLRKIKDIFDDNAQNRLIDTEKDISLQENKIQSDDILYGLNLFNKSKTESIEKPETENNEPSDEENNEQLDEENNEQLDEENNEQLDGENNELLDEENNEPSDEENNKSQDEEFIQQQDEEFIQQQDEESIQQQDEESIQQQDEESIEQSKKTNISNINNTKQLKKTLKKSTGGFNLKSILKRKNSMKNNKHIEWNNILPDGSTVIDNSFNDTDILNGLTDLDLSSLDQLNEKPNEESYDELNISNNHQFQFSDINEENQINTNSSLIPISEIPFLNDAIFPSKMQTRGNLDLQVLPNNEIVNNVDNIPDIGNKILQTNNTIKVIKEDY